MGVNDSTLIGKPIPILIILPSSKNKYMGVVYGDGTKKKFYGLHDQKFIDWQFSMLTNPITIPFMPKEELKESLMQTIMSSSETNNTVDEMSIISQP